MIAWVVFVTFTALCSAVFLAGAVALTGAIMTARGLQRRAEAAIPHELIDKLRHAPDDLARINAALAALSPLLGRLVVALAAIAESLSLAERIVFGWFPAPAGSRDSGS